MYYPYNGHLNSFYNFISKAAMNIIINDFFKNLDIEMKLKLLDYRVGAYLTVREIARFLNIYI